MMYLGEMFKYRDLMRWVTAPVWRIVEDDFYPNRLDVDREMLLWTGPGKDNLPTFFIHPFPVADKAMLQLLLKEVGEQFSYQVVSIAGLPTGQYYRLHFNDSNDYNEIPPTEIRGKKIWIDKVDRRFYISAELKKSFEEMDADRPQWEPAVHFTKAQGYYDYLFQQLREAHANMDLDTLNAIVECARAKGLFQFCDDFDERLATFFNLLLQISIDLLNTSLAFVSEQLWFFITEVYDIQFHQVHLEEYPADTCRLYFELTQRVLQRPFHPLELEKEKMLHWYGHTLYFIKMASGWFANRPEEFFALYPLIYPLCYNPEYHLDAYWLDGYNDLTASQHNE